MGNDDDGSGSKTIPSQIDVPNGSNSTGKSSFTHTHKKGSSSGQSNSSQGEKIDRFDARMGQPTTPFDGRMMAFVGDSVEGQVPSTVIIPEDSFNAVGVQYVPTVAAMDELLAQDPNLTFVGPFTAADEGVEAVNVRRALWIPNRYVIMALDEGLTPRQAWEQIRGAIVADGLGTWVQVHMPGVFGVKRSFVSLFSPSVHGRCQYIIFIYVSMAESLLFYPALPNYW